MAGPGELLGAPEGGWQAVNFTVLVLSVVATFLLVFFSWKVGPWFRPQSKAVECSPDAKARPQSSPGWVENIPGTAVKSKLPGLSSADLAKVLGNSAPDDEDLPPSYVDRSTATFGGDDADLTPTSGGIEEVMTQGAAAAVEAAGEVLIHAMEGQDTHLTLRLVQDASPAVVNYADADERNALMVGAMEGHVEACLALLGRADFLGVDATNNIGSTALHLAAANDHIQICKALIASPRFTSGVNAENMHGLTPLDFSLDFGEGTCEEALVAAGGRRTSSGNLRERRRMRGHDLPPEEGCPEGLHEMSSLD